MGGGKGWGGNGSEERLTEGGKGEGAHSMGCFTAVREVESSSSWPRNQTSSTLTAGSNTAR